MNQRKSFDNRHVRRIKPRSRADADQVFGSGGLKEVSVSPHVLAFFVHEHNKTLGDLKMASPHFVVVGSPKNDSKVPNLPEESEFYRRFININHCTLKELRCTLQILSFKRKKTRSSMTWAQCIVVIILQLRFPNFQFV